MNDEKKYTDSNIEIKQVYTAKDLTDNIIQQPAEFPFTKIGRAHV